MPGGKLSSGGRRGMDADEPGKDLGMMRKINVDCASFGIFHSCETLIWI